MIGSILKDLRVEYEITQVDLAARLNVKQSTISSWEIERTSPTLGQLADLASIYDVSCDYLIGRTKEFELSLEGHSKALGLAIRSGKAPLNLDMATATIVSCIAQNSLTREKLLSIFKGLSVNDFQLTVDVIGELVLKNGYLAQTEQSENN